nr:MAG: hypothetical protein [Bacteriophage sp.]
MVVMWIITVLVILGASVFAGTTAVLLSSVIADTCSVENKKRFVLISFIGGVIAAVGFVLVAYILAGVDYLLSCVV